MAAILGISGFYHDSAAALIVDGNIVAAAQEERFTRRKHDPGFPVHAIAYCLEEAGLAPQDIDYVGFYEKPLLKFERLLETYLAYAPAGFASFAKAMPVWLKQKLRMRRELSRGLREAYRKRFLFLEHHESHAASAFFPSPFEEAAILTLDGVGEWATASFGSGRSNRIELTHEQRFPHSAGLLYSAFTFYTGFKVNSGEYKMMGLAPYGEPRYVDLILEKLVDLKDDGSLRVNLSYFQYCQGLTMTSRKFERLFGGPPRQPEGPITRRDMDLAASIQKVIEEVMLRSARHVHATTGMKNLCLAGGVALNCVGNGRILREAPFDSVWIQPASGDAGGALGTALFISHQLLDEPRPVAAGDRQQGSLIGPRFGESHVRTYLDSAQAAYRTFEDDDALCAEVARVLADGMIVGWYQGRMEFGPRALGCRSILADPRSKDAQRLVNLSIKFRESFRPLAPAVLSERVGDWFNMRPGEESPYMLLVASVHRNKCLQVSADAQGTRGLDLLKVQRSLIPAVTHVDGSARIQTVDPERHGRFHRLLVHFERLTGCPVLANTSFNVRGEPIVCTPQEAYSCFMATNMDALVLERTVLLKREQPPNAICRERAVPARDFPPD
jgi:carbamoyltransferase